MAFSWSAEQKALFDGVERFARSSLERDLVEADRDEVFHREGWRACGQFGIQGLPVPEEWSYGYLRWFHDPAVSTMVPTPSLRSELMTHGFSHLTLWGRGVDGSRFRPGPKTMFTDLPGPHLLYVGRVSAEKNVAAFLDLDVPGTKIVVGDGPDRAHLERLHPEARFVGYLHGEALAAAYRSADVMVFPSRTDTFGNVLTEALASGTPVAAYPVTGPRDILTDPRAGTLADDLALAVERSLTLKRDDARALGEQFTWSTSALQFLSALVPATLQPHRLAKAV